MGIIADITKSASGDILNTAMGYYNKALSFFGEGDGGTVEEKREAERVVNYTTGATRLASKDGNAELYMQKDTIILATDSSTALALNDGCIILDGRVHFSHSPNSMYMQGFWKFNEELLTTVPSTLANPVQTLLFNYPPYVKKIAKLAKVLAT